MMTRRRPPNLPTRTPARILRRGKPVQYDRFGHAAFERVVLVEWAAVSAAAAVFSMDIFEDIFGEMMGGRRGGAGQRGGGRERGADLRYNMEISLRKPIRARRRRSGCRHRLPAKPVPAAAPSPAPPRPPVAPAAVQGRVAPSSGFLLGRTHLPDLPRPRSDHHPIPATNCSGQGRVKKERSLSVNIPAGIEDGTRIRLAGEGEAGMRGGPSGDLYIFLSVKPHEFFQRDGADLFCPGADLDDHGRAGRQVRGHHHGWKESPG
jgi:molecular chaperone DnaJ